MVGPRLRELMLEAPGAGELEGDDVRRGRAEHPVCGDEVELSVRLDGERIAALRWRARGCPASMALAALASHALEGTPVANATATLQQAVQDFGGLAAHERHASGLVLGALAAATTER